ncbi:hypothetical protein [Bremerella alba]|uniref:Carboxypeptidase regulatory-like domain-containing protein n=1 Tax=Bremerella alba TaxID=980252 RepID=A0A7V8VB97_9BACT|nr:hypothetical protein [Bremerella alba]MBA2118001.1 hypothetical protein [Bremerella alba]
MQRLIGLVSLVVVSIAGCYSTDNSNLPKRVPAKAVVLQGGEPVEGATVTFTEAEIRGAVGNTNAYGEVDLWTYEPGDGVIPGSYSVAIRKLEVLMLPNPEEVTPEEYARVSQEVNRALAKPPKHLIPKKYASTKTSELTVEVVDGGENVFTFELED